MFVSAAILRLAVCVFDVTHKVDMRATNIYYVVSQPFFFCSLLVKSEPTRVCLDELKFEA